LISDKAYIDIVKKKGTGKNEIKFAIWIFFSI
jgi:hypothetical protein